MNIDLVSQHIIQLALYLDSQEPGIVSELWIDSETQEKLKNSLPKKEVEVSSLTEKLEKEVQEIKDPRRRKYLFDILNSLVFQIQHLHKKMSYADFSEGAFRYRIERVQKSELDELENYIQRIEKELGCTRFEVLFKKHAVIKEKYQEIFQENVQKIRKKLPTFFQSFTDKGFVFETTTSKPWTAFNTHYAPYSSKLTLNSDLPFHSFDLYRLACHEAYGGHHSELSLKDRLLMDEGRGEHGLIITFSPQTFISEAIAEGMYYLLDILDKNSPEAMLSWYYYRLIFALQNIATYMFFDDGMSAKEITQELQRYGLDAESITGIINFSTDRLFGKYAPVYYTAFNFIEKMYKETKDKEQFIQDIFTQPTSPQMLLEGTQS